ncbi:MAG: hypothetical protein ACLQLG_07600 [Thermoguttaceae bacterium]
MAEKSTADKYPLTIYLPADVAKRLMAVAETQKRTPADLAADLLDRNLPQLQPGGTKGKIPYV